MQKSEDIALNMSKKKMLKIFFLSLILFITNLTDASPNKRILITNLPKCITLALKNSPLLREKNYDIEAQKKSISIARSDFFPHIKLRGSYLRAEHPNRVILAQRNNQPGIFDKDIFSGGVELTLPIFLGGRRIYNYRAIKLLKDISVDKYFFTKQELIYNMATTYLKIIETEKAILAVNKNIELLTKQLKDIELSLKVGKVAPVDRMKVLVPLASQRAKKKALEQNIIVLQQVLKKLIGLDKGIDIAPDPKEKINFKLKYKLTDFDKLYCLAKQNRPEYKTAKKQVRVAKLNLKKQIASRFPALNLSAQYNLRSGSPYDQDGPPGAIDHEDYWQASLNLEIPLFYGGAIVNNISRAKMQLYAAKQRLKDVEFDLKRDIAQAISDIISSKYGLDAANNNKKLALEVLRIEKLKYKMGKNTINDVLDAHADLLEAELDYIEYSFKYNISKLYLYKAIGYDLEKIIQNK